MAPTSSSPAATAASTRSDRVRASVLAATADLVAEVGVERTSIDEISARSGVAKTTIYRHFESKQALVVEAVHACASFPADTDTGSVRGDLLATFSNMTKVSYEGPLGDMMLSLMDAAQRDPELSRLLRAHTEQRRRVAGDILRRGIARGELPADLDVELTVTLLSGPLVYTKLVRRQRITEALVEAVVDSVLGRHLA